MSYAITFPSRQALALLLQSGGDETLLLSRHDGSIHADLSTDRVGEKLEVSISMAGTKSSVTLPSTDAANEQHLVDYIESIANGTAETASDAPKGFGAALCPCSTCGGAALSAEYMAPGEDIWRTRVFCRHNNCQEVKGFAVPAAAFAVWNKRQDEAQAAKATAAAADMVNHPPHYNDHPSGIECIRVSERLPFNLGNAFKYVFRHKAKNGREDLQKAHWYLRRELERDHRPGIAVHDLQEANGLARAIAAHEPYPTGAALVAIANDEPAEALCWVERLLDA